MSTWRRTLSIWALLVSLARGAVAYVWICGLKPVPSDQVPFSPPPPQDRRRLRQPSDINAIVLPEGYAGRRETADDTPPGVHVGGGATPSLFDYSDVDTNAGESTVFIEARECTCATELGISKDTYYCPQPTNYCAVWTRRYSKEYKVSCMVNNDWKVGFARSVWYYVLFAFILLSLYPIFLEPGRVSIDCSDCTPRPGPSRMHRTTSNSCHPPSISTPECCQIRCVEVLP